MLFTIQFLKSISIKKWSKEKLICLDLCFITYDER